MPLAVQDISRTSLAIAGIFVAYSGHEKDEEGKKPDINGQTVAGYPPQIAKAFQTGQLFSQHLSVLLWLSKYSFCSPTIPSWEKKEMTKQSVLISNMQPSEELVEGTCFCVEDG